MAAIAFMDHKRKCGNGIPKGVSQIPSDEASPNPRNSAERVEVVIDHREFPSYHMSTMKKSVKKKRGKGRPRKAAGMKAIAIAITVTPEQLEIIDDVAVLFGGDRSKALRHIVSQYRGG